MVLINGRKFACEACIRGHRSSSCAHTDRQLLSVRRKGRPSSQCEQCRAKRANGSFHGRCDCEGRSGDKEAATTAQQQDNGVETFVPYAGGGASADSLDGSSQGAEGGSGKGRHSLEALLNPCQCRTTGICSCCGTGSRYAAHKTQETMASVDKPASCGCNGGDKCCDDDVELVISSDAQIPGRITLMTNGRSSQGTASCSSGPRPTVTSSANEAAAGPSQPSKASCCGGKASTVPEVATAPQAAALIPAPLPPLVEGALSPEHAAIMEPDCHCGPNCGCPGCMNEGEESRRMREMGVVRNEECPEKCLTCSACVLGLTRPSGIEAIDKWMEDDKQAQRDAAAPAADQLPPIEIQEPIICDASQDETAPFDDEEPTRSERPAKRVKTSIASANAKPMLPVHPALPPFPQAKMFFEQHFINPARRQYFAARTEAATPLHVTPEKDMPFGKRMQGESDEQWQARHGFSYLTPEAIEIFDRARKFREERRQQEERDSAQTTSTASPSPPAAVSKVADELTLLRQKALAARRSVPATPAKV